MPQHKNMKIYCPITNEVISSQGKDGINRRPNYCEVWFVLSDKSKMKIAISKNAKADIRENEITELFEKIKSESINNIKSKPLGKEEKERQIEKLNSLDFSSLVDKNNILFEK